MAFSGTYAAQFAVTGLGAAMGGAEQLRAEIVKLAAFALEAEEEEIELDGGQAFVRGDRERAIPFMGIANLVYSNVAAMPPKLADSVSLNCRYAYRAPFENTDPEKKTGNLTLTYASQTHACVLEIDEETGKAEIIDYAVVDDSGRVINPRIVRGQVHGATAHGIGAALYETLVYDDDGQLMQSSFYDYHTVTSLDIPPINTQHLETPSPFTPNGAKGMGEGGGAGVHSVCNAIQDALDARRAGGHRDPQRLGAHLPPAPPGARGASRRPGQLALSRPATSVRDRR